LVYESLYVDDSTDVQQGEIRLALVEDGVLSFFLACVSDWFWKLYVVTSTVSVMGADWMPRTSCVVSTSMAYRLPLPPEYWNESISSTFLMVPTTLKVAAILFCV